MNNFVISTPEKINKVNRTVRMTEDFADELMKLAQSNSISFSDLVVQCCTFALTHLDKQEITANGVFETQLSQPESGSKALINVG